MINKIVILIGNFVKSGFSCGVRNRNMKVFVNGKKVAEKFGIDLNLRPQNLKPETYFKLVKEYEDLRG